MAGPDGRQFTEPQNRASPDNPHCVHPVGHTTPHHSCSRHRCSLYYSVHMLHTRAPLFPAEMRNETAGCCAMARMQHRIYPILVMAMASYFPSRRMGYYQPQLYRVQCKCT